MVDVDPTSVPLPNGTDVATKVDRLVPDGDGVRTIPAGAVGRVVGQERDGFYDVQLVAGPIARYARGELVARKAGQARFAARRELAFSSLLPCVVLRATVGSRAWGLADERSDVDERGAFALPFAWLHGLAPNPEDLVSADGSATYWEVEKLIRQALRGDPNTLELLFVDGVRAEDPIGAWILEAREAFVSRRIYGTFARYALSQLKKLEQSLRLAEHRALLLAWLRDDPGLSLDAAADRLAAATGLVAPTPEDARRRARDHVKQLYRSLFDQGYIAANDFAALRAFAARGEPLPEALARELRPKNAYNLLRLVEAAIAWLRDGRPTLRTEGALRERLLAVKRGEVPLADVLREVEARTPALEEARARSPLPAAPDVARADALLRRVRQETARRWADAIPGPFGRDAPPLPPTTWEQPDEP
jgi:hypothetical protein